MHIARRTCRLAIFGGMIFLVGGSSLLCDHTSFRRGDVDRSGSLTVGDAIDILGVLFRRSNVRRTCLDAADVDDNGFVDVADAVRLLTFLFARGDPPAAPYPYCWVDPTPDFVSCNQPSCLSDASAPAIFGEADGMVVVVEKSGAFASSGELEISKRHLVRSLRSLPAEALFGFVFFDRFATVYPPTEQLEVANSQTVARSIDFVESTVAGSGSCLQGALEKALTLVASRDGKRISVFLRGGNPAVVNGGDLNRDGTLNGQDANILLRRLLPEQHDRIWPCVP